MGASVLQVKNLRTVLDLSSGSVPVVDDVSFDVGAGETLGIVGESGSGKSMTALSIMQVLPQPIGRIESGEILLEQTNLVGMSDEEIAKVRGREIGMILQDPHTSLNPVFTVGNQVIEALQINNPGTPRRSLMTRVVDLLKKVNVADAARRVHAYPHQMSGGMKQRVVGAIAIAGAPKVIIADEPTTALDVTIQLQYLQLLREIQDETGTAILFITHDLGIVANLCHKLVVMYGGKIVESGTVSDVFRAPSHPYTEALLNSVPSVDQKVDRLYAIEGQPPALSADRKGCSFAPRCPYAQEICKRDVPQQEAGLSGADNHFASCWNMGRKT
ncbi:dipeptide/oligopeptide/nickel ABC transporter ATP-binding protein [Roseobacter cerasinus]|uniref:Dipeptide/oligopeptide/nickel ABC transporter ATP-binding protein n=1 Tax=Roseobacter cerasinus TaxID=2602289 RepID=A0A640VQG7_9RHOB|nr:ABC transporter ATP-binding protein [Roseobacter cerasinus]GFE49700.1 dipeptide/oligopeptide/nickel ABC transporter ATP-binding protein [Roseobacter cerasinus]